MKERGQAPIARADLEAITRDSNFSHLVERAILALGTDRQGGALALKAGNHVGQALLGGRIVEVEEKVPGASGSLLAILSPTSYKMSPAPSPLYEASKPFAPLVRTFVASARTYLSTAKMQEYVQENHVGSLITGRLDVVRTLRLHASGAHHKAAFRRSVLTDDVPFNWCVYVALGDVASARDMDAFGGSEVSNARVLRAGFSDAFQSEASLSRVALIDIAEHEAGTVGSTSSESLQVRDVAFLSAAVLRAASTTGNAMVAGRSTRSWFINLEHLFERALRTCLTASLKGRAQVGRATSPPPVFTTLHDRLSANPDIVIKAEHVTIIADAKYKHVSASRLDWPNSPDIYELLVHAAAYGATRAALFYPSDGMFCFQHLGRSATGCDVWAFGLPMLDFRSSIEKSLALTEWVDGRS